MTITSNIGLVTSHQPRVVVYRTADGKLMRGDKEVKYLEHDELLKLIDELLRCFERRPR
jgi:hypothetical protein